MHKQLHAIGNREVLTNLSNPVSRHISYNDRHNTGLKGSWHYLSNVKINYQYPFEEDIKACCQGYSRFVGSIQDIQHTVEHASAPHDSKKRCMFVPQQSANMHLSQQTESTDISKGSNK